MKLFDGYVLPLVSLCLPPRCRFRGNSEDLRVESQRQLLAQGDLEDLERSLQGACHKLRLCEEEVERLQRASAERKQDCLGSFQHSL